MYEKWEIVCKKGFNAHGLKCSANKTYRIKDRFPPPSVPMVSKGETWYEIVGDTGMCQIPHSVLCDYFEIENVL